MAAVLETAPVPDAPSSALEARRAYLDQTVIGYLLYGVGAVTAFLAVALSLSDAQAALHSSLMAIGFVIAGLSGDRLDRWLGPRMTQVTAYLLLLTASVCIATAPAFAVTLLGAGLVGVGSGILLAHVNRTLTRGGGSLARVRMGRAALVAMVGSISVPLVIGLGENLSLGWQLAFVVAFVLSLVGLWSTRARGGMSDGVPDVSGPLPGRFWLAWWLIVLVVSVEFSIVFWASTLVERQTGISLGDATLVAAAFYAGMATARVGLSFHLVGSHDPVWLMRGSLAVALLGSLLAWAASDVVLAGLGIYLGGLGTGFLYPLGVSVALALVPGLQDRASARLILASGVAILVSPFALGVAADIAGVSVAWLLVPTLCLTALGFSVLVARTGRPRGLS
jgi:MFS family permease